MTTVYFLIFTPFPSPLDLPENRLIEKEGMEGRQKVELFIER